MKRVSNGDTLYTLNSKKIMHIRKRTKTATGTDAVQMHFFIDAQGKLMLARSMDADYAARTFCGEMLRAICT